MKLPPIKVKVPGSNVKAIVNPHQRVQPASANKLGPSYVPTAKGNAVLNPLAR